jgi:hypothetical protein
MATYLLEGTHTPLIPTKISHTEKKQKSIVFCFRDNISKVIGGIIIVLAVGGICYTFTVLSIYLQFWIIIF